MAGVHADAMRTRPLGKSGIEVSEIGLGTWGLSGESYGPVDAAMARKVIETALDEGCNFIDTAACYGPKGLVETVIGDVLAARGRDKAFVATRIGVDRGVKGKGSARRFDHASLTAFAEDSLRRLRTDFVDAIMLHNPSLGVLNESYHAAFEALRELRARGKARLIGVSAGSEEIVRAALASDFDLISVPYNILHTKLLHRVAAELSRAKVGVIAHSALAYGLLADTWSGDRVFGGNDHRKHRWSTNELARRVQQRDGVRTLVHDDVANMREAAIRYVLSNQLVSVVVVGARTPEMARLNAHAADKLPYLADKDLGEINARMKNFGVES